MNYNINLYCVRHGEAYHNISKDYLAQNNIDALLTPKGLIQSEEVGLKLQNIKFTKIYCSPLSRTIQTCNNILKYNNYNSEYIIDFHDYIQEYPYNVLSNLRKSRKILTDYYIKSLTKYKYNDSYIYENNDNENIDDNIISFFKVLRKNLSTNNNILIISHNRLLIKMFQLVFKININYIDNCDIITLNNNLSLNININNIKVNNVALCLITKDNKILFVKDNLELKIPEGEIYNSDESLFIAAYRYFLNETNINLDIKKILYTKYIILDNKKSVLIMIKYDIVSSNSFYNINSNILYLNLNEIKNSNLKIKNSDINLWDEEIMFS